MNEAEFKKQLKLAQSMLEAMQNQRNAALNEGVQLAAQLRAAQEELQELKDKKEPELPLSAPSNPYAENSAAVN